MNSETHSFKLRKMIFKCRNDKFVDVNSLFLFPDKRHYYTKDFLVLVLEQDLEDKAVFQIYLKMNYLGIFKTLRNKDIVN